MDEPSTSLTHAILLSFTARVRTTDEAHEIADTSPRLPVSYVVRHPRPSDPKSLRIVNEGPAHVNNTACASNSMRDRCSAVQSQPTPAVARLHTAGGTIGQKRQRGVVLRIERAG